MKARFLHGAALWTFLFAATLTTSCSDDDYKDVDGQKPTVELTTDHIRTEVGREFTISGLIKDADGIRSIRLQSEGLRIDKTIDLLEIYQEPIYSYELKYNFTASEDLDGGSFPLLITIIDLGGRSVETTMIVSMDGDFTDPTFTVIPSGTITVLIKEQTKLNLRFTAEDNMALDYVEVNIPDLNINEKIDAEGKKVLECAQAISLPSQEGTYDMTLTAVDKFEHKVVSTCKVNVSPLPDFPKMYLTDVADAKSLTKDLFGVPMLIDHTGEFEYEARYYSEARGTKVRFIPQKTDFYPICFGIDPSGTGKLTDEPSISEPIVLTEKGYYKITFNTKTGVYKVETYTPDDEVLPYGELTDPNPDDIVPENRYEYSMVITGKGLPTIDNNDTWSPNWNNSIQLTQDSENKYILYTELELTKGRQLSFVVTPYHPWGWWLLPAWHFENKSGENEYCIKNDNSMEMSEVTVPKDGKYMFKIDYHLCRAKLYPID